MNLKKLICRILILCMMFIAFTVTSCISFTAEEEIYTPLDYSEMDAVNVELDRISIIESEGKQTEALWRTVLLHEKIKENQEVSALCEKKENEISEKLVESLNAALEENKFCRAKSIITSLKNCGMEKVISLTDEQMKKIEHSADNLFVLSEINPEITVNQKNQVNAENASDSENKENAEIKENKNASVIAEEKVKVSELINGTVTIYVDKGIKIERGYGMVDGIIGSGFFISSDGYIITNQHVVQDCVNPAYEGFSRLYVKLAEDPETKIPAKIIGYDSLLDLALLKIEVKAPYVFKLGSSDNLDVGDKIYAIGSPLGLDRTLTSGIVSAKDRKLQPLGNVFQIDAAVNGGNSGGPMIDEFGNVQAVVFAGVKDFQGLNFAIPVEYLKYELQILYECGLTADRNERNHVWTGCFGKTKKLAGSGAKNEGVTVYYVMPGGSASRAGIVPGDVIIGACGKDVSTLEDLQCILMGQTEGTVDKITVLKENNERQEMLVYFGKRPDFPGYEIMKHDVIEKALVPNIGMELQKNSTSKNKFTVIHIIKGSNADNMNFSENDIVNIHKIEFNNKKSEMLIEIYTKKRKAGYLDATMGITMGLDNPYYF